MPIGSGPIGSAPIGAYPQINTGLTVSNATASGTTSATVTKPSGGWATGNTLVAIVVAEKAGTYPTLTPPTGWTSVESQQMLYGNLLCNNAWGQCS